jgi:hypothetical protein
MKKFGSQGAKDSTAVREKWIQQAAEERVKRLEELDRILNRPIGSTVPPDPEKEKEEFAFLMENPDEAVTRINQRAEATGMPKAILEFLQYAERMR